MRAGKSQHPSAGRDEGLQSRHHFRVVQSRGDHHHVILAARQQFGQLAGSAGVQLDAFRVQRFREVVQVNPPVKRWQGVDPVKRRQHMKQKLTSAKERCTGRLTWRRAPLEDINFGLLDSRNAPGKLVRAHGLLPSPSYSSSSLPKCLTTRRYQFCVQRKFHLRPVPAGRFNEPGREPPGTCSDPPHPSHPTDPYSRRDRDAIARKSNKASGVLASETWSGKL